MKKHLIIRVFGKVQGVWFRKTTKDVADQLGIVGIVMNEPDGSVYIQASGNDSQMEKFIAYCHQGPDGAEVLNVQIAEEETHSLPSGFQIIR